MITKKYYKLIRVSYADEGYFCLTNVSNSIGNVKIEKKEGNGGNPNYEYSIDGVSWNAYTVDTNIQVNPNSNIYWRYAGSGDTIYGVSPYNYGFAFDFDCYASGNVFSLFSKTDFANYTGTWQFMYLFKNQTHLLRADFNLGNITTISYRGLNCAFFGCSSLTSGPDLSNITSVESSGLQGMYYNCSSLTAVPDLSNITTVADVGFAEMFYGCSSLTTGANISNVTSLGATGMRAMYNGCINLTSAYAPTITWDTNKSLNWLNGVKVSSGTNGKLYADASIASTIPTSNNSGCPANWTVVS